MSLYLHESITPEVIREAKKAGITGVKSYPAGVTTVSSQGLDVHTNSKLNPTRTLLPGFSITRRFTLSLPRWRNRT